jgi:CubicO group peptidase (beta-lactamase class C family)
VGYWLLRWTILCGFVFAVHLLASDAYPPTRFTDPDRVRKLEAAMPEVDQIFRKYVSDREIPGLVWGVVIDGRLAQVESAGVRERTSNSRITASTVFRIASMTKSFTALAIL